jgi:Cu/Ag efflux protein CusF
MQQPGMGTTGTQGTVGQQLHNNRFHATVESIDQDDRTVELRPEGSTDKVEFKVPNKEILSGLKKGDRVQVSIDKTMSQSR